MTRAHIFINGRVQGVGFRHFTRTNARQLGLKGWVKNLPDGRVEAVFEGDEDQVEKMIDLCRDGPRSARVRNLDIENREEVTESKFESFRVAYH